MFNSPGLLEVVYTPFTTNLLVFLGWSTSLLAKSRDIGLDYWVH